MIRDIITVDISNRHYKKMENYLRSLKIIPERIAISINENNSTYCQINWKNILSDGHKVKKIIFLKSDNIFLYVGFSSDDSSIVYNKHFSKFILLNSILLDNKLIKADVTPAKVNFVPKNNTEKINVFLDKISKNGGIESLTFAEQKELDYLSKSLK